MNALLKRLASAYQAMPYKPFKGILIRGYTAYRSLFKSGTVIETVDGIAYALDLNQLIDSMIHYSGCFEPATTRAIERLCQPGMTVLDIGANIGCHTLRMARRVGPQGKVIAFEPMSWAHTRLQHNLSLNAFLNVTVEKIALSDENRPEQEVTFPCSWPLSGVPKDALHPITQGQIMKDTVDMATLDSYLAGRYIPKVDFIKLDVDGYEAKVLRGARKTLETHHPAMILELGHTLLELAGDHAKNLTGFLSDLGYHFYAEEDFSPVPDVLKVLDRLSANRTVNVIASARALEMKTPII